MAERQLPPRSTAGFAGQFVVAARVLFVGVAVSCAAARCVGGESAVVLVVGFFTMPSALVASLAAWQGAALLSFLGGLVFRRTSDVPQRQGEAVAASAVVLVPVATIVCAAGGALAGLLGALVGEGSASGPAAASGAAVFACLGLVYGLLVWHAARRGYLDFSQFFDDLA